MVQESRGDAVGVVPPHHSTQASGSRARRPQKMSLMMRLII